MVQAKHALEKRTIGAAKEGRQHGISEHTLAVVEQRVLDTLAPPEGESLIPLLQHRTDAHRLGIVEK